MIHQHICENRSIMQVYLDEARFVIQRYPRVVGALSKFNGEREDGSGCFTHIGFLEQHVTASRSE